MLVALAQEAGLRRVIDRPRQAVDTSIWEWCGPMAIDRKDARKWELFAAVQAGDAAAVKRLISQGADPTARYGYGEDSSIGQRISPLDLAAKHNLLEVAEVLISHRGVMRPDGYGLTPLHHAVQHANPRFVRLLLNHGAGQYILLDPMLDGVYNPLLTAAKRGDLDIMESILAALPQATVGGVFNWTGPRVTSPHLENAEDMCVRHNETVQDELNQALLLAAYSGSLEVVLSLLNSGADADCYPHVKDVIGRCRPLCGAVSTKSVEMINTLVARGARVDGHCMNCGTALHKAVRGGRTTVVDALLTIGASVNSTSHGGMTPLHECPSEHSEIAAILIVHGAKLDALNEEKRTPLHIACALRAIALVKTLLDHGASLEIPDVRGLTPLHVAVECGDLDMVELLLTRGANVNARDSNHRTPRALTARGSAVDRLLRDNGAKRRPFFN